MSRKFNLLILSFVLVCPFLLIIAGSQSPPPDCELIRDALKQTHELKPGDPRSRLEQDFELDGGLQFTAKSRYVFKKCQYIKIDVEFAGEGIAERTDVRPTDKISKISQPYLAYPVND